jgi:hypothetical protein
MPLGSIIAIVIGAAVAIGIALWLTIGNKKK